MFQTLLQLDGDILLWIQEYIRNDFLTPVMRFVTMLGDAGFIWIASALLLLCVPKTRRAGILTVGALAGTFFINNVILKNLVARIRPYDAVEGLAALIGKQADYSFPSGHAGCSFAAGVTIFLTCPKKIGIPALILAFVISFSRLYVGVHYPSDVLGGIISGTLIAFFVRSVSKKIPGWQGCERD